LARRRRGPLAYIIAAGFIILLVLEVVAIMSPAFNFHGGAPRGELSVTVYAPAQFQADAETIAKAIAQALGDGYSVKNLGDINISAVAIVVIDRGEPLLVVFTVPQLAANPEDLQRYSQSLAGYAVRLMEQLPSNTTLVYMGGNQTFFLPRNMTVVEDVIAQLFLHAQAAAANMTSTG